MVVRISIVSDSFFYVLLDWKQFAMHCFVLIRVKTSVSYNLQLALNLINDVPCFMKESYTIHKLDFVKL
jgi:hypothetical protein